MGGSIRGERPGATSVAERIAQALGRDIDEGVYQAGDQLPTEQALGLRYGASRAAVREAISRLKSDGLVRSARGSGLYVAPPEARRSFKIRPERLRDRGGMLALLELRETVEAEAAALAARRRDAPQLARIRAAHEAFVASAERSEASVAADVAFHVAIAEATGNPHFAAFVSFIGGSLAQVIRTALGGTAAPRVKRTTGEEHAAVLDAIARGDAEAARAAMIAHLAGVRQRIGG